jgi:hypothetical protein
MLGKLKEIILDVYGIDDFNTKSNERIYADSRIQFIYRSRRLGNKLSSIGSYLHKHHSTIYNAYNQYINFTQTNNQEFINKSSLIDEAIEKHYHNLIKQGLFGDDVRKELNILYNNAVIFVNKANAPKNVLSKSMMNTKIKFL